MAKRPPDESPMMKQYARAKAEHPDCLLMFHMGDFFELFHDDAVVASRVLGLTLTSRQNDIPMAGVPVKAADGYIQKLVAAGHRVAVCEQVEQPAQAKGLVRREITRVISAGTVLDESMLAEGANNYLAALCHGPSDDAPVGLAYVDLSTGEFVLAELTPEALREELARIRPAEVIIAESRAQEDEEPYVGRADTPDGSPADGPAAGATPVSRTAAGGPVFTKMPDWVFEPDTARRVLLEHFGVATLEGFGCEGMDRAVGAAGAILRYLAETQKTTLGHIGSLRVLDTDAFVSLDSATVRNLELVETARERKKSGSLLGRLDRTRTAMGARHLRQWVLRPLRRVGPIRRRQGAVADLAGDGRLRESVREALSGIQDIERLAARVSIRRANARDLRALALSVRQAPAVAQILRAATAIGPQLADIASRLADHAGGPPGAVSAAAIAGHAWPVAVAATAPGGYAGAWTDEIVAAIHEDAPAGVKEGGLFADGFDAEVDRLRAVRDGGKQWLAKFQADEVRRTGIPTLKVGYNKVFGYFIEITKAHQDKAPDTYVRKQTLVNAERYITPELKEHEAEVLGAEDKLVQREYELFLALREKTADHVPAAQRVAGALADLDALASLAEVADRSGYVCPDVDESRALEVSGGRHPTLEAAMPRGTFVPNDLSLDGDTRQILLVTGPNMAGKSTYIRSAALWVLMAQMGSFVPADKAHIGVADRIFTRVGASDDIGRGQSTFMVEMVETAHILNGTTDRSFVVLDEIGRGTSTFDGVAIAWAVVEHLHGTDGRRARTLFATHYHELTELAGALERVHTCNVAVREWQGEITFLHKIVPGAADRSYGIHVAKIAGVPPGVTDRAWEILDALEKKTGAGAGNVSRMAERARKKKDATRQVVQLALFGAQDSDTLSKLAQIDASQIAPIDALKLLDELAQKAKEELGES